MNKKEFLISKGWRNISGNCWVHSRVVTNPCIQNYTNYGMTLEEAVQYELSNSPPISSLDEQIGMAYGNTDRYSLHTFVVDTQSL